MSLQLQAPAKTNLTLRVIRKRADGFHDIESIMVKLPGLHDTLTFEPADAFSFTCSDPSVPSDDSNLVVKAAHAYQDKLSSPLKFSIALTKRVPHGAGLGGGSSDAATTLLGLNQLHDTALSQEDLHEIASSLGSDIPFFLIEGAAKATGRGEIIETIDSPPSLPLLLLKPSFSVATPDAYKRWADSKPIPGIHYDAQPVGGIELINDLERPVFEKHRFLAELKQWLLDRPETSAAMLSGSGASVFAVLKDSADAEKLADSAREELDPTLWHWTGNTGI